MSLFENAVSADLVASLKEMRITNAFDSETADFSKLLSAGLNSNPYIGLFKQNSRMKVDQNGTKVSAASIIGVKDGRIAVMNQVTLDRPFVYGIIDVETGIPLFLGCMNQMA